MDFCVATSVNDVMTVNVIDMDLRKRIAMAQDMDITVNNTINLLLGKRPNGWKDESKNWHIWIPQSPNKNTALTNHSTLRNSKPIQILNKKQAKRSLFLSEQPDRYTTESANNQSKVLLPGKTIIKTVDEKIYRSIEEENNQESPV